MSKPTTASEILIVAADMEFTGKEDPRTEAWESLKELCDMLGPLGVTMKINAMAEVLGAEGVDYIQSQGLKCFLDLKSFDIGETLKNNASWIQYYNPAMLTVCEWVKPSALIAMRELLPKTLILPVGPLTDLDDNDFEHFGAKNRNHAISAFFSRVQDGGMEGVVCSPRDLRFMCQDLRESITIVTPAVKPAWSVPDNNSANALTPAKAIQAGADYIVVGRGITKAEDPLKAAKDTIKEIEVALAA